MSEAVRWPKGLCSLEPWEAQVTKTNSRGPGKPSEPHVLPVHLWEGKKTQAEFTFLLFDL